MAGEIGWFPETGSVLASFGFGLPVVNFMRGSTMLAQIRATALTGTTTLTVPFSTNLTVGAVQAQVYAQTGNATYSLVGTLALTVTDTRPGALKTGSRSAQTEGGASDRTWACRASPSSTHRA